MTTSRAASAGDATDAVAGCDESGANSVAATSESANSPLPHAEDASTEVHGKRGRSTQGKKTAAVCSGIRSSTSSSATTVSSSNEPLPEEITAAGPSKTKSTSKLAKSLHSRSSTTKVERKSESANLSVQPEVKNQSSKKEQSSAPIVVNTADPMPRNKVLRNSGSRTQRTLAKTTHMGPDPASFSFAEILASIEDDIKGDIDAIAQIAGKSRLSLANEYDSHLPPHAQIAAPAGSAMSGIRFATPELVFSQQLETVDEVESIRGDESAPNRTLRGRPGSYTLLATSPISDRHSRPMSGTNMVNAERHYGESTYEERQAENSAIQRLKGFVS
jgi:hypothetical protein